MQLKYFVIVAKKLVSALEVFIQSWLYPLLVLGVTYAASHFGLKAQTKIFYDYLPNLFLFVCLLVIISAFSQFRRARWRQGFSQIGIVIYLFFSLMVHLMFYPWNHYADNLEIPKNLNLKKPERVEIIWSRDTEHSLDSAMQIHCLPKELRIVEPYLQDSYRFYSRLNIKMAGSIYLKAFEVTKNDPLSTNSLKEKTLFKVIPDKMRIYHKSFSIYEGDPGKPYAARFELWFAPESGAAEKKVLEEYYIIQGLGR